jgi:trk system potassium uptake protein
MNPQANDIEANVPKEYVGKTTREIGFRRKFNLLVINIMKKSEVKSLFGKYRTEMNIEGIATPDQQLEETDILVMYGANKDLQVFLKQNSECEVICPHFPSLPANLTATEAATIKLVALGA